MASHGSINSLREVRDRPLNGQRLPFFGSRIQTGRMSPLLPGDSSFIVSRIIGSSPSRLRSRPRGRRDAFGSASAADKLDPVRAAARARCPNASSLQLCGLVRHEPIVPEARDGRFCDRMLALIRIHWLSFCSWRLLASRFSDPWPIVPTLLGADSNNVSAECECNMVGSGAQHRQCNFECVCRCFQFSAVSKITAGNISTAFLSGSTSWWV